jgi:hypothetical protein
MSLVNFKATGGLSTVGNYTLIEEKEFDSATNSWDMITSLDGETDGAYYFEIYIVNDGTSGASYQLRYNSTGSTGDIQWEYAKGIELVAPSTKNKGVLYGPNVDVDLFTDVTNGEIGFAQVHIFKSIASTDRTIQIDTVFDPDTTNCEQKIISGQISTPNSSTGFTGFGIATATSSGIGVGSIFRCFKLK